MTFQSSKSAMYRTLASVGMAGTLLGAGVTALAANVANPPANSMTPAAQAAARNSVSALVQHPTLASIKQVDYTDQGVETWIQVQGTGNCTFTIETAGMAPQPFASSAAKPFPMKVKIAGAPLGSHQWIAKGTGSCVGSASATFSVNG